MKWILTACVASLSVSAVADTVVDVRSGDRQGERISIQGDWVRMDGFSGENEYVLGDLNSGNVYVVMPGEKTILELHSKGKNGAASGVANVKLQKLGSGPEIAGFDTTEYELMAGGQSCGKALISAKAGAIADVQRLLKGMAQFDPGAMMPEGMGAMVESRMDVCDKAQLASQKEITKLGMPMKSLDQQGQVEQEVTAINTQASLAADLFKLPQGYQRTTPGAMINDAMSQMQEMMKNVSPEERQMMEQMMKNFGAQIPK